MELNVSHNIAQVQRRLSRVQRKQIPFAAAKALTKTAQSVQRAETKQLPQKLDRPTRFTERAFAIKPANKRNLMSRVFAKDIQAEYLHYQIHGGTRRAGGKGTGVPTRNKRLNKYGNIAGRRKGLVKGKRQFIGTIKGVSGVWQRTGGKRNSGVKLMVAFEESVQYQRRFPFYKIAQGVVKSQFPKRFQRALVDALRTAR